MITRRGGLIAAACLLGGLAGCANSRAIYVPHARFDPARPERIGREPRRGLPPLRRRDAPMELSVDPPAIEPDGEIRFEPPEGDAEPPLD